MHFRRNIFNIPSGKAGKSFITELAYWLKQFNYNSNINSIALKAFMILPTLIIQKLLASSKSKEHSAAITQRLAFWNNGDLGILMKEIRFIKKRLTTSKKARSMDEISFFFAKLLLQGNISAALTFLQSMTKFIAKRQKTALCLTPQVI